MGEPLLKSEKQLLKEEQNTILTRLAAAEQKNIDLEKRLAALEKKVG